MDLQTIAAWATIITAIIAVANFLARWLLKKDIRKELKLSIRLTIIGILGSILGLFVWALGAPILGTPFGYGLGAIIASVFGGVTIALVMCIFIKRNAGKLTSGTVGFLVVWIVMASTYWVIAWFILNDLYNTKFTELADSTRGVVSNIIGWGIAGVIGNTILLPVVNFIDMLFMPESNSK